jgi:hypothetical protein
MPAELKVARRVGSLVRVVFIHCYSGVGSSALCVVSILRSLHCLEKRWYVGCRWIWLNSSWFSHRTLNIRFVANVLLWLINDFNHLAVIHVFIWRINRTWFIIVLERRDWCTPLIPCMAIMWNYLLKPVCSFHLFDENNQFRPSIEINCTTWKNFIAPSIRLNKGQ